MRRLVKRLQTSAEFFLDSFKPPTWREALPPTAILLLGAFAAFASLAPNAFENGDAAVYAQQIERADFSNRTIHLGYYLVGFLVASVASTFNDYLLNLMSCGFGASTLVLIYLISLSITRSHGTAVVAATFLATNYIFALNSILAEVYIVQTFFLILALQLWLSGKPILAGGAFAFSTLVTPSSLLAGPSFAVLQPRLRPLLTLGITSCVILVPVLFLVHNDYLFGGRGVLAAAVAAPDLSAACLKEAFELVFGYFTYLPFLLFGFSQLMRKSELRSYGVSLLILWLITFALGEKGGDVPVQLPTWALLAPVAGIGLKEAWPKLSGKCGTVSSVSWLTGLALLAATPILLLIPARERASSLQALPTSFPAAVVLFLFLATLLAIVLILFRRAFSGVILLLALLLINISFTLVVFNHKSIELQRYRDSVFEAGTQLGRDDLVIGNWSEGILFDHYLYRDSYRSHWINTEWLSGSWGTDVYHASWERLRHAIAHGDTIWLLGDQPDLAAALEKSSYSIQAYGALYRATGQPDEVK